MGRPVRPFLVANRDEGVSYTSVRPGFAYLNPGCVRYHATMLLKIIAFIAAAIPIILFVRAMFFRRPTRLGQVFSEFKKQIDYAVWIFLVLIACVALFAAGKLLWTWWETL
jgi:hypothetical protein